MLELLTSQLMDPFRIGLMFFLLVTALRTRATMGLVVPLCIGVVFIAILLPLTTSAGAISDTAVRMTAILVGVAANAIILSCVLAGWAIWSRARG